MNDVQEDKRRALDAQLECFFLRMIECNYQTALHNCVLRFILWRLSNLNDTGMY